MAIEEEHLDPTTEINAETVKERAVKGVVVLTGRTFILSFLSLAATALLTVFLSPAEFGIFWIVSAVVNFLSYFSDIGLAAALIQKKDFLTKDDLNTTFIVQQSLVVLLLIILFGLSPLISKFYSLGTKDTFLLYSLGVSFFLSSLKTIPSTLLERKLEFGKLVIPQIAENLVYNFVAVILAYRGWGVSSFAVAVLARGAVGLFLIYTLQPWFPGLSFSKQSLKKLLSYGLPYQANTFLAVLKDDGMTALLGGILGASGIGLLGWAQKWAYAPLRFFMDHVTKVTFPAFARMQEQKEDLKRSATRSIFFICFLVFPSTAGLLILSPVLVRIIPRYSQWEPALIPLMLISVNTVFASFTTQVTNLLNAVGKIKITFRLMIMWTVLTWAFVPTLGLKFGVNGSALGYALVGLSSIIAVYIAKKYVDFSILEGVIKPGVSAVIMSAVLLFLRNFLPDSFRSVLVLGVTGAVTYIISSFLVLGKSILNDAARGFSTLLGVNKEG